MKCIRCGDDHLNKRICSSCMKKWTDMRSAIYTQLVIKYGVLTPTNHEAFKKEMKRLEKIWKKDLQKFDIELIKLNNSNGN